MLFFNIFICIKLLRAQACFVLRDKLESGEIKRILGPSLSDFFSVLMK